MDLYALSSSVVSAISPPQVAQYQMSTGYATGADGKRVPSYAPAQPVLAQVQPMQFGDIAQADGLNIQGIRRKIYFAGDVRGIIRVENAGGDIVTLADGSVYKVAFVAEQWPDWCSVVATMQNGS